MRSWRVIRLVVLLLALGGLAWTLVARGPIGRLGTTKVATLETPYKTELQWAVQQTASDLEEMAAFAARRSSSLPPKDDPTLVAWDPDSFVPMANTLMPSATTDPAAPPGSLPDIYPSLTAMTGPAIINASVTVSQALADDMRNPRAHEAAALVIGAFALREAADSYHDVRWSLNRMTAHLALARALRHSAPASPDGVLADVILLALANHQQRAVAALAQLGDESPPNALNAWVRALRIRLSQDWRTLPDPSTATRLEKLEYFRARRATVGRRRVAEDLQTIAEEPAADLVRIVQHYNWGVEDGQLLVRDALGGELADITETHRMVKKAPMPALDEALNQRATRLIGPDGPQVLPWGAWAEYFQRHLAMHIADLDALHRSMLGDADGAQQLNDQVDRDLGKLTWFAMGTARRNKGRNSTEADLTHLAEIIDLAVGSPELITQTNWLFFDEGSSYEPVPKMMPKTVSWFTSPTGKVPYEAGVRLTGRRLPEPALIELMTVAPLDVALLSSVYAVSPLTDPPVVLAKKLLRQRAEYDLKAGDIVLARITDASERAEVQRLACALSSRDCAALAGTLVRLGDEAGAVREYERAFADPMMDSIALSGQCGWLVNYYYRTNRHGEALELSERAAGSGSLTGLNIRAYLLERLGRLDEADELFLAGADRYNYPAQLLGFYHRQFVVKSNPLYAEKWKKKLAEVFPDGLQPVPTSMPAAPRKGVFVYSDNARSKKVGLRVGDIIVGLEGWRVENFNQYRAINAFKDDNHMKITMWRGTLVQVEADMPGRLFGIDLRDHPVKGWIE